MLNSVITLFTHSDDSHDKLLCLPLDRFLGRPGVSNPDECIISMFSCFELGGRCARFPRERIRSLPLHLAPRLKSFFDLHSLMDASRSYSLF